MESNYAYYTESVLKGNKIKYYINKCTINSLLQYILLEHLHYVAVTVLGNVILKGQLYYMPREVSIGIREMESHMHFRCLLYSLWHSRSS